jgi:DNA repair exonuclease SbcCD nuclease subunit
MKICILGDTHFGMRGDSLEFHNYYKKFYEEVFFPYLIENNIDTIFQMGDLFDRRKFINFNTLYLARQYFFDKLKEYNITFHTILGNHDIYYKNILDVNSSQMLLKDYNNIIVYDEPKKLQFDGVDVDVIPWICADNDQEINEFIKSSTSQICFGHFEIAGFEMDRGNISHEGIDKNILKRYDVVLSGHFHHKSSDGQITYVGTPGEMTWADYNDPRGFHLFDTDTRELAFIQNPYRMFNKITYDDGVTDFEYWKAYDYDSLKECFVKIVVLNKQNPYLFDNVVDNLYKAGVGDIAIVEDFTETIVENDQELIDQAEDTLTIINRVIDGMNDVKDTNVLKSLVKELYLEALNVEKNT